VLQRPLLDAGASGEPVGWVAAVGVDQPVPVVVDFVRKDGSRKFFIGENGVFWAKPTNTAWAVDRKSVSFKNIVGE
jgi:hypothetical protein